MIEFRGIEDVLNCWDGEFIYIVRGEGQGDEKCMEDGNEDHHGVSNKIFLK